MLLSVVPPQTPVSNHYHNLNHSCNCAKPPPLLPPHCVCKATANNNSVQRPPLSLTSYSSPSTSHLHHVTSSDESGSGEDGKEEEEMVASAAAVAAAIRSASSSPVQFVQSMYEKDGGSHKRGVGGGGIVLPSPDFQRLCLEQLDLFRRIVNPDALLSVYVRPAGSYVMDRLELRRITVYPDGNVADIVILVGNFSIPAGLRAAEAVLSSQQAEFLPELRAVVFPMVKHPFVVGFLVAELPEMVLEHDVQQRQSFAGELYALPSHTNAKLLDIQATNDDSIGKLKFTVEQRLNAINISRSLAMAYVMDQKAMLLQQSSWQNNVRMSTLVEQIRDSLSSIRTMSRMLSLHMKRSEISYDIVEDILVQGDHMSDTLQQIQDAVYMTKAHIMRYNEEMLKKMHRSTRSQPESLRSKSSSTFSTENSISKLKDSDRSLSLTSTSKDLEMPMPPLALAPLHRQGIRACNVSDVLSDLVGAVEPLAHKQQRVVELCELSSSLEVAVEEPALRQALSNLIEGALVRTQVGGKVEIVTSGAPAGGALVMVDDDGPDMHYMTQMHSLTPFGADLFSRDMVEDNMTWNFIAGLTVAREILESYGCVVRVISPRITDAALGTGGTRIELWLPTYSSSSDIDRLGQMI